MGLRIAKRQLQLGWTNKTLSIQANVPEQTISDIKNGKRDAKMSTMVKLADSLSVTLDRFQPECLDKHDNASFEEKQLHELISGLSTDIQKKMLAKFQDIVSLLKP